MGRGGDDDAAYGCGDAVAECAGVGGGVFLLGGGEVGDGDFAFFGQVEAEADGLFWLDACDFHLHGEVGAVEQLVVEGAFFVVVVVEVQALGYFGHEVFGLHCGYLVDYVGLALEEAHGGEVLHACGASFVLLFDEYLGRAGVDFGRAQDVEVGESEAYGEGYEYPGPVAQGHEEYVAEGHYVGGAVACRCFILGRFHVLGVW